MSERAKRRRVGHSSEDTGPEVAVLDERTHLYSIPDRGSWKGFCEIESEPVSNYSCEPGPISHGYIIGTVQCHAARVWREKCQGPGGSLPGRLYVAAPTVCLYLRLGACSLTDGLGQETRLWFDLPVPLARG